MKDLNTFQKYFVEEFYDDYRDGLLSRRAFVRRVAFVTGSMTAAAATMSLLGCAPSELPAPAEPMPSTDETPSVTPSPVPAGTPAAELVPVPGARRPLSVPNPT